MFSSDLDLSLFSFTFYLFFLKSNLLDIIK